MIPRSGAQSEVSDAGRPAAAPLRRPRRSFVAPASFSAMVALAVCAGARPPVEVDGGLAAAPPQTRELPGADASSLGVFGLAGPRSDDAAPAARSGPLDPVFEQRVLPGDVGVGPFNLLAIATSCIYGANAADDFVLDEPTVITRVTWQAVYFGAGTDFPGQDAALRLSFHRDNGAGNVGAVIADYPAVSAIKTLHPRAPIFGAIPVYNFSAELDPPVSVAAGERIWLSINGVASSFGGPSYGWMASFDGNAIDTIAPDQPLHSRLTNCAELPASPFIPGGELGLDSDLAFALYSDCAPGDCNCNGVSDAQDVTSGAAADCNGNGVPDECDIAGGFSFDCDADGVPDECQFVSVFTATSPVFSPFGSRAAGVFTVPAPPQPEGDVTITIAARSDLSHSTEFVAVLFNGVHIANVFVTGGRDCPSAPDVAQVTLTAGQFNALVGGGGATIRLEPSSAVSESLCGSGSTATVQLSYGVGGGQDCNGNGVLDACDIASGHSTDCDADGVPDECQIETVFLNISPELSPIGQGAEQSHDLGVVPVAAGPVTLSVSARGDFSAPDEYIDVLLNGVVVGRVLESGGRDCPATADAAQLIVPSELFNDLVSNGDAVITLRASFFVSPNLCGASGFARVSTSFLGAGAADCNNNGVLDACEIAAGAADSDGDGRLDACSGVGDLNNDGAVNAADLATMLAAWGAVGHIADLNGDGIVNAPDLALLLSLMR